MRFELIFKFEFTTSLGGRLVKIKEKPTLTKKAKWGLFISLRNEINRSIDFFVTNIESFKQNRYLLDTTF